MAATMNEFLFPPRFDLKYITRPDDKVCVVSILGKSDYSSQLTKAGSFNQIADKDVFQGYGGEEMECYYDSDSHIVYLHHWSTYDTSKLISLCAALTPEDADPDFNGEIINHAKNLLFLFSVSHLVIVNHPGSSFDVSYIQLFNSINNIRLKWHPFISDLLREFPLPSDWIHGARPCSPRTLFVFNQCLLEPQKGSGENQRSPNVRRLQHAIEDQIYRLLRKSRTITNTSNNSLFAVPANQEFVYIHTTERGQNDPVTILLSQLRWNCMVKQQGDSPRSPSFGCSPKESAAMGDNSSANSMFRNNSRDSSFREFIEQHTQQALTKGFDDNVGRNPIPAVFEMCSSEVWFAMATTLYNVIHGEILDARLLSCFNNLNTDIRFSDNRCSKLLPSAESTYQNGLPTHYTQSFHQSKLAQAMQVFRHHARGPCLNRYLSELEQSCDRYWHDGHQLCEAISLTGNHCIKPLHSVPGGEITVGEEMPHCSQYKTPSACNCGQRQAERDDPFNHKAANYDFYQELEKDCCQSLEKIDLPVFKPSTTDVRAWQADEASASEGQGDVSSTETRSSQVKTDLQSGLTNLSLALSLEQSGAGVDVGQSVNSVMEPESGAVTLTNNQATESKTLTRQPSTVEYLPGMINTNSASGLLPLFPSWSISCLGKVSLYSTSQGLNQPGFLAGSNFLLPWELPLTVEKEKWPTVGEGVMRKGKQRRPIKEVTESTVRAYLGMEYECPIGHRFFCSGPEKIIKVSSTSTVKDNANKLLTLDMPLYCPCQCRSTKGLMSQLMRVFVLVPEGPIKVIVNPRVRPAPPPCPVFHPGTGPLELSPGKIWVIRLPYVYLGPSGVIGMPSDPDLVSHCRLIQGMFDFIDTTLPLDT